MPRVSEEYRHGQAQRILRAARACFADDGFHAVTMDQIIAAAGVSSSTVYRYYPEGKTQLIHAVSAERLGPLIGYLEEVAGRDDPAPPDEVLREAMSLLLPPGADEAMIVQGVRLAVNAWAEAARDEVVRAMLGGNLARIRALVTAIVRSWMRCGRLSTSLGVEQAAELLMDAGFGLVAGLAIEGGGSAAVVRRRLHRLSAAVDEILAAPGPADG